MKSASVLMTVSLFIGAFIASPELRAFAANTVGSLDIIDESILTVDIKKGEVKGPDLAGNAITTGNQARLTITTPTRDYFGSRF